MAILHVTSYVRHVYGMLQVSKIEIKKAVMNVEEDSALLNNSTSIM